MLHSSRSRNALEKRKMPKRRHLQMSAKKNLLNRVKIPLILSCPNRKAGIFSSILSALRFLSRSRSKRRRKPEFVQHGWVQTIGSRLLLAIRYEIYALLSETVENSYSDLVRRGISCLTLAFTESVVIRFPAPRTDRCGLPK